jgi:glycosyltransferase involved in cell wall biosynthesis
MKVAVAHEWLVRYAGSERCVEEILAAFPGARLLSTVAESSALPALLHGAELSFLQRLPGATRHHEALVPLMPLAWRLRKPVDGVDIVISSSHACAKAVRIAPGIPHLCYCHTPMRYAWDFESEALRFPSVLRPAARLGMAWFRRWDRATTKNVDAFIANSTAVAGRIMRYYGRSARVVHPPVRTDFFTPGGTGGNYFLFVGRLTGYKRPDLVLAAFTGAPYPLIIVGTGPLESSLRSRLPPNVSLRPSVSDYTLRSYYRGARALVYPVEEDFGLAMAEAQACGTPVIALARGGAMDIIEHGVTGWLLPEATPASIREAVEFAAKVELDAGKIRQRAERFSADRFRQEMQDAVRELLAEG